MVSAGKRVESSRGQGGPPLNVGVNLPTRPSVGQAAPGTLFFYVCLVFVFVMVLHGFLDQFKCRKPSSRVGAVHVFMKLTDLEKYEKCTYIRTSFRGRNGRPFLKVLISWCFYFFLHPGACQPRFFDLKVSPFCNLIHPTSFLSTSKSLIILPRE